uniref:Kelch repeat-containing protein n=2 Tax=Toxoplasma gondii TaxID=5811 RepID=A0A2G8XUQ0_TOXGO|nr:kelch repeat-containing protein [Toxoplasma gondii COUG]PUA83783.1 kelch repeat-containing protein [Toxoplasma gondii TgCATBr9]
MAPEKESKKDESKPKNDEKDKKGAQDSKTQKKEEKDVKKDVGALSPACFCLTEVLQNAKDFKSFECHSVAFVGREIFCYGAKYDAGDSEDPHESVMVYDYQENLFSLVKASRREGSSESAARESRLAASFVRRRPSKGSADPQKGVITLFGGENSSGEKTDRVWNFDPVTSSWKEVLTGGPAPNARSSHAACSSTDFKKMYVHGGIDCQGTLKDDAYVFNEDDVWAELPLADPAADVPARCYHTLVAGCPARSSRECLLLFGGDSTGSGGASNELWIYYRDKKVWKQVTDASGSPPRARMKHSCAFANNRMWICGGEVCEWFGKTSFKDLYGYDLSLNYWFLCDVFLARPGGESLNVLFGPIAISSTTRSVIIFGNDSDAKGRHESVIYRATPVCTFAYLGQAQTENRTARKSLEGIASTAREIEKTLLKVRNSVSGSETKLADIEQQVVKVGERLAEQKKATKAIIFQGEDRDEMMKRMADTEKTADAVNGFEARLEAIEARLKDVQLKLKKKAGKRDVQRVERAMGKQDLKNASAARKARSPGSSDDSSDSS